MQMALSRLARVLQSRSIALSAANAAKVCIVGAGPVSLLFASKYLESNPHATVDIYERSPRRGTPDENAFGFGVGDRGRLALNTVPGLKRKVEAIGRFTSEGTMMVNRRDLVDAMLEHLEARHPRIRVTHDTSVGFVDLEACSVEVSTRGESAIVPFDLLVGADGVNSSIRDQLVERGLPMERYLRPVAWKALRLPPQPSMATDALTRIKEVDGVFGALLPRFPEGHSMLVYWRGPNPWADRDELRAWLLAAAEISTVDDDELDRFLKCHPGTEHVVLLPRFHDGGGRVALLGDAAHDMYSTLGQGCAAGWGSALTLSDVLSTHAEIPDALEEYSRLAVPEAHAVMDMNLISHLGDRKIYKLLALPLLMTGGVKKLHAQVNGPTRPYTEIRRKHAALVWLSRQIWKRERVAFEP